MSEDAGTRTPRKLIAWITLSMDGYASGPGNDMSRIAAHAGDEEMMAYSEGIWRNVSTAVMGRTNYEGFLGYWPPVARDPSSTPRNRDLATWLDTVEKVVFSRTMQRAEWQNSRVSSDLEGEIGALKQAPGRDILVINSVSIIRALLQAGLLDELVVFLAPIVLGGGLRFFPDGLTPSDWRLISVATFPMGDVALRYGRA